ncbi:CHAD domain-containing protein [Hyphococcus sp.]|uniref:CHAD domain-containing protein n=1 Tax=Hyphococcus sp. TaxID=2038636 RepID=UPI003CCBECDF
MELAHRPARSPVMAYSFKHKGSIQDGVRRIAASQLDMALEEIDDLPRDEAVHQGRKRCKKLRGLIRIIRPGFADYHDENAALRDAARRLSDIRDRTAMIEAFDRVAGRFENDLEKGALAPVRRALKERKKALDKSDMHEKLECFRNDLIGVRERAADWSVDGSGLDAVEGGVKKTYARAIATMEKAKEYPTGEALHEWRKRVKYHWYHARLLKRAWRPVMEAHIGAADALSDLLGDHHDLVVFEDMLKDGALDAQGEAGELFVGLIKTRRDKLEEQAFKKGAVLCAEKPKALARRWTRYWRAAA